MAGYVTAVYRLLSVVNSDTGRRAVSVIFGKITSCDLIAFYSILSNFFFFFFF